MKDLIRVNSTAAQNVLRKCQVSRNTNSPIPGRNLTSVECVEKHFLRQVVVTLMNVSIAERKTRERETWVGQVKGHEGLGSKEYRPQVL